MIPTLDEWKNGTAVKRRWRSAELENVDTAIAAYHADPGDRTRDVLRTAWLRWKQVHGRANFRENARNQRQLLDILDAEFSTADGITKGAISQWTLTLPLARPAGFVNLSADVLCSRIDKAIVNAQSVLALVCERLRTEDADTVEQVRVWFGTTLLSDVRDRFNQIEKAMRMRFKVDEQLAIVWLGAGHWGAAYGNLPQMGFGNNFFSDETTNIDVRPGGRPNVTPAHIAAVRSCAEALREPDTQRAILGALKHWCETAPPRCASLQECVDVVKTKDPDPGFVVRKAKKMGIDLRLGREAAIVDLNARIVAVENLRQPNLDVLNAALPTTVTAAGTVIHEMSHMILSTKDQKSPLNGSITCYGPVYCVHLASEKPELAILNADNYRLFAECCMV